MITLIDPELLKVGDDVVYAFSHPGPDLSFSRVISINLEEGTAVCQDVSFGITTTVTLDKLYHDIH